MTARHELQDLAAFLRRRRDLLRPVDAGLPEGARRRTAGLRREEVAMLAVVSVDYYTRLEQARSSTPSAGVVSALAQALQCDEDQREHLFLLAGHPAPPRRAGGHVRPGLIALGNRLGDLPMVICSDLGEVLWSNPLACALLGDVAEPTGPGSSPVLRWFAYPAARRILPEQQERISAAHVADLRAAFTRRRGDREVTALVEQVQAVSPEFSRLWVLHDVGVRRSDRKTVVHPEVGEIPLRCEVLLTPDEDVAMHAFFPIEGTEAQQKLDLLSVIGVQVLRGSAV